MKKPTVFKSYIFKSRQWLLGTIWAGVFSIMAFSCFIITHRGRYQGASTILDRYDVDPGLQFAITILGFILILPALAAISARRSLGDIIIDEESIKIKNEHYSLADLQGLKIDLNEKYSSFYGKRNFLKGGKNYMSFRVRQRKVDIEFYVRNSTEERILRDVIAKWELPEGFNEC